MINSGGSNAGYLEHARHHAAQISGCLSFVRDRREKGREIECVGGSKCLSASSSRFNQHFALRHPAPPILVPALVNERKHRPPQDKATRTYNRKAVAAKLWWLCWACLRGISWAYIYGRKARREEVVTTAWRIRLTQQPTAYFLKQKTLPATTKASILNSVY